jgi:hypothetical protein
MRCSNALGASPRLETQWFLRIVRESPLLLTPRQGYSIELEDDRLPIRRRLWYATPMFTTFVRPTLKSSPSLKKEIVP